MADSPDTCSAKKKLRIHKWTRLSVTFDSNKTSLPVVAFKLAETQEYVLLKTTISRRLGHELRVQSNLCSVNVCRLAVR